MGKGVSQLNATSHYVTGMVDMRYSSTRAFIVNFRRCSGHIPRILGAKGP